MATITDTGQRCIGDWIVDACPIGQGSFAVVWKATHRTTHQPAAIKEINLAKLNARLRESLESEISVLSQISHPNVVQLYEVLETNSKMFLIMEYCSGGDLSQYFKAKKKISEQDVRLLMSDIAAGLAAMYRQNLVHRDLKPQNLLLSTPTDPHSPPPTLKIADFGFARALAPELMAETLCGSPLYVVSLSFPLSCTTISTSNCTILLLQCISIS
jgi:serine/threonine-protein kinase ULK/ATG1